MSVSGRNEETSPLNVLSLFGEIVIPQHEGSQISEEEDADFLDEEVVVAPVLARKVATENQFPDQSMHILDQQLSHLRESISRIKFYLGDIDDLIPR